MSLRVRDRRNNALNANISSPLENLADQDEDLTRTQMARRMLKRTRQVAQIVEHTEVVDSNEEQERNRKSKRTKRTVSASSSTKNEYIAPLNDFHSGIPPDASQFQTPFGENYIHPSLISRPLIPEEMSPLPVTNRILSRTASRNFKENVTRPQRSSSKGLASPFTSRHNSDNSSPGSKKTRRSRSKSKTITKPGIRRPVLATKANSYNSTSQTATSSKSQVSQHHIPSFTMNHSAHTSPRHPNPLTRNRFPSSHTLAQISRPDWFVPPKIISRSEASKDSDDEMHTPPDFDLEGSIGSSSFLAGLPDTFSKLVSTPARKKLPPTASGSEEGQYVMSSRLYALGNDTPAFFHDDDPFRAPTSSFSDGIHNDEDVRMADNEPLSRKTMHISANSIVSTSGDFTLAPSGYNLPRSNLMNANNHNQHDSLFPSNDDITMHPSQAPDYSAPVQRKISLAQKNITSYLSSPAVQGSTSVSFVDVLMAAEPSVQIQIPSPERSLKESLSRGDVLLEDLLGDMGIHGSNRKMPSRTQSLDNSTSTSIVDKSKGKQTVKRARAGTIRASDFQKPQPPALAVDTSRARRTRSGTIVGPNASSSIIAPPDPQPSSRASARVLSVDDVGMESSEDELLLKSKWVDADLEYIGLPARQKGRRAPPKPRPFSRPPARVAPVDDVGIDSSDDELLLKSPWVDHLEYTGLPVRQKGRSKR
ncbi:hypothetical protein HWV62_13313 [Athelia sp. TMB]|nr:hypothetical protein HWV62_13313 [Athelia sp. TMB]